MPNLNALIVNFRTPELTLKCVASIVEHGIVTENHIIVVDNNSQDNSTELLSARLPRGVTFVSAPENRGFSAGINFGAEYATEPLLLILNPDTYFIDRSLQLALERFSKDPELGIIGLDLINPDGTRQFSARRFYSVLDIVCRRTALGKCWPLNRRVGRHLMIYEWCSGSPFEADWVMGTGFVIRRDLFERIGRMDESYFLYMEDVDLCARAWAVGARVEAIPGSCLVHDHQRASAAGIFSFAGRNHIRSLKIFSKKFRLPVLVSPQKSTFRMF